MLLSLLCSRVGGGGAKKIRQTSCRPLIIFVSACLVCIAEASQCLSVQSMFSTQNIFAGVLSDSPRVTR